MAARFAGQYRLGIDLGSNSLGWSVLRLNDDGAPDYLVRLGVRIFSSGRNPKNGESLAVDRRNARQQRRRRDRKLSRSRRLLEALREGGLFPREFDASQALKSLNPYDLRLRGLGQRLELFEIGRAILHLNQRRGFKSNRRTDRGPEAEAGKIASAVNALRAKLSERGAESVGAYLYERWLTGQGTRARRSGDGVNAVYEFYPDRAMTALEFDLLWERQAAFHPALSVAGVREKIRAILFFQRPLRPVSPGRCSLDPSQPRAPLALPSVQTFRMWQEINNLRVRETSVAQERHLTEEERLALFGLLSTRATVTFAGIRRGLRLPAQSVFNLEGLTREKLLGNLTSAELSKPEAFGPSWRDLSLEQQDAVVALVTNDALGDDTVLERLVGQYGLPPDAAHKVLNANLIDGYGRVCLQAINQLLPFLRLGLTYDKAANASGYETTSTDGDGSAAELPYYGVALSRHVAFGTGDPDDSVEVRYGKIANPSVHIALNELKKVVNSLIKRYGKPAEVVLELTRDIKLGWKKARDIEREQQKRQQENNQIKDALSSLNQPVTRDNILRMRLYGEMLGADGLAVQCVYTGEQISIDRLLSSEVEVDHLLPYSRTLDDSIANKVLSLTRANRVKGNQTPFEAFGGSPTGFVWNDILDRASRLRRGRLRRFEEDAMVRFTEEGGFQARQLNDTAYMSRLAREYLSLVCPPQRIGVTTGQLTGMLRGKWGLNTLLGADSKKNRLDQRHHAIDATVIACIDRALVQRVARAADHAQQQGAQRLLAELEHPWPTFRPGLENAMARVVISYRPDHSSAGPLHNDTAYGVVDSDRAEGEEQLEVATRTVRRYVPVSVLTDKTPEALRKGVVDGPLGEQLAELVERCEGNKPALREGITEFSRRLGVQRVRWQEVLTVIPIADRRTGRAYKFVKGDGNHCIEIFADEAGEWVGETIQRFFANQPLYQTFMKSPRFRTHAFSGKPLVMRLMVSDTVRLSEGEAEHIYRVQQISKNRVTLAHHRASGDPTRNPLELADARAVMTLSPRPLRRLHARRVFVDVLGRVLDPGFSNGQANN